MNRNNSYYAPEGTVSEGSLRRRIFFINLFCILAAIGLCLWFLIALRVETVAVEGVSEITETAVLDAANIKTGKHLFAINEKKIERAVASLSPYVEKVTITRTFPSTITVIVTEHNPLYRAEKDGTWYLLSHDLTVLETTIDEVFARAKAPCLLTIPTIKEGTPGKTLTLLDKAEDARVKELLAVFSEFPMTEQLTSLDVRKSCDVTAVISGQYTVCFGDDVEMSKKLKLCQKAVRYLGENMGRVAGILYAWTPEEISFVMTGVAN